VIFPILRGFLFPKLAPITYFLFAINLFVFVATYDSFEKTDGAMELLINDDAFLETQGSAFATMIKKEPAGYSEMLQKLANRTSLGDIDSRHLLGSFALRNVDFMSRAGSYDFGGDEIALRDWRLKFAGLIKMQEEHPSFQWGVSHLHAGWRQWFTYQFAHSGASHLFMNMIFLLLFGIFVETNLGGSFVVLTYLGGGLAGAASFSMLSGLSSSPLIGASAAISALMSLVGIWWIGKDGVRFFYFLLPKPGYYGFVLLPSWLVLVVSMLPDLSSYLSSSREFGSVAYSAHLGGALWGAVISGFLYMGWMVKEVDETVGQNLNQNQSQDQKHKSNDDRKAG
jgi:membrane associated rhomboid family serine protease